MGMNHEHNPFIMGVFCNMSFKNGSFNTYPGKLKLPPPLRRMDRGLRCEDGCLLDGNNPYMVSESGESLGNLN